MALRQRAKINARVSLLPEGTFDSDAGIATAYILNLAAESGFVTNQARAEVPVYKGTATPHQSVLTKILAQGKTPMELEFTTIGRLWKMFVGASGYARPGAGVTTLHDFQIPTAPYFPLSCQLQADSLEATAMTLRNRGVLVNQIGMQYATSGGAGYDVDFIGVGDELQTQLIGSPTDEGFTPVNFFNGYANLNSLGLTGLDSFSVNFNANLVRTEAAFTGGLAGSLVPGVIIPTGTIGLLVATTGGSPEADFNFYNYAVQDSTIPLEIVWQNTLTNPTQWCRLRLPGCKFERNSWKPGGPGGLMITQNFRGEQSVNIAAEAFGTVVNPNFTVVTGVSDKSAWKIDGGGTITATLTAGATTALSHATQLNANGGFTAVAIADVWQGRLRVTSKGITGPSTSVQFDTTVANNVAANYGFTNVSWPGYKTAMLFQIFNTKGSDY